MQNPSEWEGGGCAAHIFAVSQGSARLRFLMGTAERPGRGGAAPLPAGSLFGKLLRPTKRGVRRAVPLSPPRSLCRSRPRAAAAPAGLCVTRRSRVGEGAAERARDLPT